MRSTILNEAASRIRLCLCAFAAVAFTLVGGAPPARADGTEKLHVSYAFENFRSESVRTTISNPHAQIVVKPNEKDKLTSFFEVVGGHLSESHTVRIIPDDAPLPQYCAWTVNIKYNQTAHYPWTCTLHGPDSDGGAHCHGLAAVTEAGSCAFNFAVH